MNPQEISPVPFAVQDNSTIPSQWPQSKSGFGLYAYSKRAIMSNVGTFLVLGILSLIGNLGINVNSRSGKYTVAYMVIAAVTAIIAIVVAGALAHARLAAVDGKKASIGESLSRGLSVSVKVFFAEILTIVSLAIALVLLIIPFFILLPRLALVNYFIVDQGFGPIEAYKASMSATKGNATNIWSIYLAQFVIALLAITIIGLPFSIYFYLMYSGSFAIAYRLLTRTASNAGGSPVAPQQPVQLVQPTPPSPLI
jgi:hypothetical protein